MIISALAITSVQASSVLTDIATVVTVRFGYDWQADDYTGSVTYAAPEQVRRFGSIERVIEAPFCSNARAASRVAEYWCQRLSVPQYTANIDADRSINAIRVSDEVDIDHPYLPGGYVIGALVTGREYNPETGAVTLVLLLPSPTLPAVELTGYSGRFVQSSAAAVQYSLASGDLLITLTAGSTPLSGVTVTIDGTSTTSSDISGVAVFRALSTGKHSVVMTAAGYQPMAVEVTVAGVPVELSLQMQKTTVQAVTSQPEVLPT